jgi:hypothetical protein
MGRACRGRVEPTLGVRFALIFADEPLTIKEKAQAAVRSRGRDGGAAFWAFLL